MVTGAADNVCYCCRLSKSLLVALMEDLEGSELRVGIKIGSSLINRYKEF
jgi:hypothetical protein